ncbi:DUF3263 domain-containing protein [Ornithinimicrobium sufpigmenti]|uniref:DUF3263 domain-containing protein n=1 Tax=Ornithinimicrobium sufpigmenti TaxID=2508882 RepID=UPI0015E1B75E|nr:MULTISPECIES: DUF3263 domain-containing protein [unclassified Ornithinimicrobium]
MALTQVDRAILRAAAGTYRNPGDDLDALTRASGVSLARTWQRLNQLINDPDAWKVEPGAMQILAERRARYSRGRRSTSGA